MGILEFTLRVAGAFALGWLAGGLGVKIYFALRRRQTVYRVKNQVLRQVQAQYDEGLITDEEFAYVVTLVKHGRNDAGTS